MDLFIPYGYTPYEGETSYGVFSNREKAEEVLIEQKVIGRYEIYDIYVCQLDTPDNF